MLKKKKSTLEPKKKTKKIKKSILKKVKGGAISWDNGCDEDDNTYGNY